MSFRYQPVNTLLSLPFPTADAVAHELQSSVTHTPPATPTDIMLSSAVTSKPDSYIDEQPIIHVPKSESKNEDCCCVVF